MLHNDMSNFKEMELEKIEEKTKHRSSKFNDASKQVAKDVGTQRIYNQSSMNGNSL